MSLKTTIQKSIASGIKATGDLRRFDGELRVTSEADYNATTGVVSGPIQVAITECLLLPLSLLGAEASGAEPDTRHCIIPTASLDSNFTPSPNDQLYFLNGGDEMIFDILNVSKDAADAAYIMTVRQV